MASRSASSDSARRPAPRWLNRRAAAQGSAQAFATRPPRRLPLCRPALGRARLHEALAASYANNPQLQASARPAPGDRRERAAGSRRLAPDRGAGRAPGLRRRHTRSHSPRSPVRMAFRRPQRQQHRSATSAPPRRPSRSRSIRGGRTRATDQPGREPGHGAARRLIAQEQTTFTDTVNAYVGVIQAQQLLALNINNEQVLARQLQATNDRFRVGEITRTDVAQAEAALAGATAQRQTSEGNLQTARGTYPAGRRLPAAGDLVEPQPLDAAGAQRAGGLTLAAANNPNVSPRRSTTPRPRTRSTSRSRS